MNVKHLLLRSSWSSLEQCLIQRHLHRTCQLILSLRCKAPSPLALISHLLSLVHRIWKSCSHSLYLLLLLLEVRIKYFSSSSTNARHHVAHAITHSALHDSSSHILHVLFKSLVSKSCLILELIYSLLILKLRKLLLLLLVEIHLLLRWGKRSLDLIGLLLLIILRRKSLLKLLILLLLRNSLCSLSLLVTLVLWSILCLLLLVLVDWLISHLLMRLLRRSKHLLLLSHSSLRIEKSLLHLSFVVSKLSSSFLILNCLFVLLLSIPCEVILDLSFHLMSEVLSWL